VNVDAATMSESNSDDSDWSDSDPGDFFDNMIQDGDTWIWRPPPSMIAKSAEQNPNEK
jgi:hypothetical protein